MCLHFVKNYILQKSIVFKTAITFTMNNIFKNIVISRS